MSEVTRRSFLGGFAGALLGTVATPLLRPASLLSKQTVDRAVEEFDKLNAAETEEASPGVYTFAPGTFLGEGRYPRVLYTVSIRDPETDELIRAPYVQVSANQFEVWTPKAIKEGRLGYLFEDSKITVPPPSLDASGDIIVSVRDLNTGYRRKYLKRDDAQQFYINRGAKLQHVSYADLREVLSSLEYKQAERLDYPKPSDYFADAPPTQQERDAYRYGLLNSPRWRDYPLNVSYDFSDAWLTTEEGRSRWPSRKPWSEKKPEKRPLAVLSATETRLRRMKQVINNGGEV